ncbi:MAG TPA: anti-sigma factor [Bryobacteraceae bacterium]|jgi:anti-sigma factor RsiW|nr:anti-sigma factor [Bryobacteraceae bacterium]
MNCVLSRELMGAYLDEELEPGLRTEIQGHLAECRGCTEAYSRLLDQKADIRSSAPHYKAPAVLTESVRTVLHREAALENAASKPNRNWRWMALAASILLLVSIGWNLVLVRSRPADRDALAESLLSSHVSSLIGTHLLDVPSSDQHTVKPWFNGKLDFSPDVKDLTGQGFPLIGGRIEYLSSRTVAVLVFRRRQHVINLFIWPATPAGSDPSQYSRKGFNLVHWNMGGMTYWAISDITVTELQQFRDLYEM